MLNDNSDHLWKRARMIFILCSRSLRHGRRSENENIDGINLP